MVADYPGNCIFEVSLAKDVFFPRRGIVGLKRLAHHEDTTGSIETPIPNPVYPKRKDLGVNSLCVGRRIEAPMNKPNALIQLRVWALRHLPVLPNIRRTYHIEHLHRCLRLPTDEVSSRF